MCVSSNEHREYTTIECHDTIETAKVECSVMATVSIPKTCGHKIVIIYYDYNIMQIYIYSYILCDYTVYMYTNVNIYIP